MPEMQRLHETHRQGKGGGGWPNFFCCKHRHDIYAFKIMAETFMQV